MKQLTFTLILVIIICVADYAILSNLAKNYNFSETSVSQTASANTAAIEGNQLQAIQSAANKVSPAVVSIDVVKNVSVPEITYKRVPINGPFGSVQIAVPVFSNGQTEQATVGSGTGFLISHDGYILTNNHVIFDNNALYVITFADNTKKTATVVYKDSQKDIAVLKVDGTYQNIVKLGNSSDLRVGQGVAAIGNSLGIYHNSIAIGSVSGFNRDIVASGPGQTEELNGVLQTSAPITSGFSGGPLVDQNGHVVGITVAKVEELKNVSFSIPINSVKESIKGFL